MVYLGVFCLSSYPVFLRHGRHPATCVVAQVGTVAPASSSGVVVQLRLQVLGWTSRCQVFGLEISS